VALPGQTLFIMGASGAGKTSLLNAISGRIKPSNTVTLTGKTLLNNHTPISQSLYAKVGAYVTQDDILF
jgi:ABC-type molybdate transport system ATPase subunit